MDSPAQGYTARKDASEADRAPSSKFNLGVRKGKVWNQSPREGGTDGSGRLFIVHLQALSHLLAFVQEAVSPPNPGGKKRGAGSWDQALGDVTEA